MIDTSSSSLVSIVIRTTGQSALWRQAVDSVSRQSYQPLEIILVEDGPSTLWEAVRQLSADIPELRYQATGQQVGRCAAGNVGLKMARGQWLGFLDDDDELFPNHVASVLAVAREKRASLLVAGALEWLVAADDQPVRYRGRDAVRKWPAIAPTVRSLSSGNSIPIQAVLFHRSLYERHGGLDESLDALEDWDLWARYMQDESFVAVPVFTSRFRVPYSTRAYFERRAAILQAYPKAATQVRQSLGTLNRAELSSLRRLRNQVQTRLRGSPVHHLIRLIQVLWARFSP